MGFGVAVDSEGKNEVLLDFTTRSREIKTRPQQTFSAANPH